MRRSGQQRILLAVTSSESLVLLRGIPEFLADQGWEVHIACSGPVGEGILDRRKDVTVHNVNMKRNPSPFHDLRALISWFWLIREIQPDVVSAGTPKAGLLGMLSAKINGVRRRTYHLRGLRLEGATGGARKILAVLEWFTAACSTDILVVSPSLREVFVDSGLAPLPKTFVLGSGSSNGVDTDRFRPNALGKDERLELKRSLGLRAGRPVIGYVGRLTRDKGLIDLAQASARLHAAGLDHQVLVIGGMDQEFDDPWTAAGLTSEQRPVVTGSVKDTAPYYQVMDLLALPTKREGFPNVVLEAAASGIPTVTTTATGARDAVEDGTTGRLVQLGDVDALSRVLGEMIGDAATRLRMGQAARDLTLAKFERGQVWRLLDKYYRSDLKRISGKADPSSIGLRVSNC